MRRLGQAAALLLSAVAPAPAGAAPSAPDARVLEEMFTLGYGESPRFEQALELDGCSAVLTLTAYSEAGGTRRLRETSRFEIQHFDPVEGSGDSGVLELSARDYFSRAGDPGLGRWLAAIAETAADDDRSARLREIQMRVERGEFGRFAARNGFESRSYLEGDVEPYYALTLPAVGLHLPERGAEAAERAWLSYAGAHCSG